MVTYAEIRTWARWLGSFTPSDLADAMGVDASVGERGVKALLWHGICQDSGVQVYDRSGEEPLIEYVPLPPGPREHATEVPPERLVGYTEVLSPRGMPVRIRTERMMRQTLSTAGARQFHKNRQRAYERQQEANRARAERDRRRRIMVSQGRSLEEAA